MGVSNGYDIGVNGRDLILKTSGKIYVKVADKFYELDFRNEKQKTDTTESSEIVQSDVVLLDTLSKENYPGDNKIVINNDELYITKGGSYKKINTSIVSEQEGTVEVNNNSSNDLFIQISDGVWSLGESSSGLEIEIIDDPEIKWSDYWFFNASYDYFFDDISWKNEDYLFWINIFFNAVGDDPAKWTTKSKSEIESTILTDVYKNGKPIEITEFKNLYNAFWYSESAFDEKIASYTGPYAELNIDSWTQSFSPKAEIKIGESKAIITSVIGDSIIIKFKDNNVTLNAENIQKSEGSFVICKKDDSVFLDVAKSDLSVYDSSVQNPNEISVRLGNLDTLNGYSGIGAFFNENVTIKNGPFTLNSDGSGSIGTELSWDSVGNLFGNLLDRINMLEEECQQLRNEIDYLHDSASLI